MSAANASKSSSSGIRKVPVWRLVVEEKRWRFSREDRTTLARSSSTWDKRERGVR